MRIVCISALLAALAAFGQVPVQIQPGQPIVRAPGAPAAAPVPPDKVLAIVNTDSITAAKVRELLVGAPPQALNAAASDPKEFLAWTYLTKALAARAEKLGLDKKTPYSDQLQMTSFQVLAMARIQAQKVSNLTDEDLKAWYDENAFQFTRMGVKLIYVAVLPGKEAEGEAKLKQVQQKLKSGTEFGKVAQELSDDQDSAAKDGDFGVIEADSKISAHIRKKLTTQKANEVSEPFRDRAGYYLFQVTSRDVKPFDQMKEEIRNKLAEEKMNFWMQDERAKATVVIKHEPFFRNLAAQTLAKAIGQKLAEDKGEEIKPETVLAEINGKPLTAERFTGIMKSMPPQSREKAIGQPNEFLKQLAFMERLTQSATQMGLDKQAPFNGQLWYNRGQVLMQAAADNFLSMVSISNEEQKAGYDKDPGRFQVANVKAIRVAYSLTPPPANDPNAPKVLNEEQARKRAEAALAEIMGGMNFAQAVAKYADDEELRSNGGTLPPLTASDPRVPPQIKDLVFKAKEGDVLGPVKMPNGFYLFRVESNRARSYDEMKDQVYEELRQQRFQEWFDKERSAFNINVTDADSFRQIAREAQGR